MAVVTFVWTQVCTSSGTLVWDQEVDHKTESWIQTSSSPRGPHSCLWIQAHSYSLGFPKIRHKEETSHHHLQRAKMQKLSYSKLTTASSRFSEILSWLRGEVAGLQTLHLDLNTLRPRCQALGAKLGQLAQEIRLRPVLLDKEMPYGRAG